MKPVMVTTKLRLVAFGWVPDDYQWTGQDTLVLERMRVAIRWATTRGFPELAEVGPNENSKISATVPRITLNQISSVADVTPEAADAWSRA